MRDFDGDISKLATHRKTTPFATGGKCLRVPTKAPGAREFHQEYHTGGVMTGTSPAYPDMGVETVIPNEAAAKLRAQVDKLRKSDLPVKNVTVPIMFDSDQIKEIIAPIIRQHIGRHLGKKLWERLFDMCDGQLPFVLEPRPHRLVVIESPFGHPTKVGMEENAAYGRQCMRDSLSRGEAPYASHLLYTQCLDDLKTAERKQGMEAGFAWGRAAQHVAVYTDRGVSKGMIEGIKRHQANGKTIEFRSIDQ